MDEFVRAIKKAFDFKGRSGRKEFFMFMLIAAVLMTGMVIIDAIMGFQFIGELGLLTALFAFFLIAPMLSVTVRRLHDTGRSGRFSLLYLLPVGGWIALILFAMINGDLGRNMYGEDPNRWNTVFSPINTHKNA